MIALDNTDVIEGGASVASVVDYVISGIVGTTITQLAAGTLSDSVTTALYTAGAAVGVDSINLVNTHSSAVTVTLRLDPADGGNPRWLIPKEISLEAGQMLCTNGRQIDLSMGTNPLSQMVCNLKPVVNGSVNKLDIFTKSGGAVPDSSNIISVAVPDGNGYTFRSRAAAVASGTGQIIMADAANYWSKGSLDAEIKTAYLYAIWSSADAGIVWALGGYSGFTRVPASVTATDDDFFLLEDGSSYTKVITDYCVCAGKIRYQYDTADTPDHTIQATVLDAPQAIWNPKSDYGKSVTLAARITSAGDYTDQVLASTLVKQSGRYFVLGKSLGYAATAAFYQTLSLRTGSSTYASAILKAQSIAYSAGTQEACANVSASVLLNAGDTIHLGVTTTSSGGSRIHGDDSVIGSTGFIFGRMD